MNYGEVKNLFRLRLNRRDLTPTLEEAFLKTGIQRAQRLLRVPASESTAIINVQANDDGRVAIPGNYLKLVSVSVDDHELQRVSLEEVLRYRRNTLGNPKFFARDRTELVLAPYTQGPFSVRITYHADFSNLNGDADRNWLTEIASDIIINASLHVAFTHFVDPRRAEAEEDFLKAVNDLNLQAADDELTNAAIAPSHGFDFGDY